MDVPAVVVAYDPRWPSWFEGVRHCIDAALAEVPHLTEHVGSTAIPGLAAKPIIDVDVVVPDETAVDPAIKALAAAGWRHQGDLGIEGREAFRPPADVRYHHLYVVVAGSQPHRDHIDLRDFLRRHPDQAARYAEVKRRLSPLLKTDRAAYTDGKADVITELLQLARHDAYRLPSRAPDLTPIVAERHPAIVTAHGSHDQREPAESAQPGRVATAGLRRPRRDKAQLRRREQARGYLRARLNLVYQEYTRVWGDLIALHLGPDDDYGKRATTNLEDAQASLHQHDMQAASDAISQADQALVCLSADATLKVRSQLLIDQLQSRGETVAAHRLVQTCSTEHSTTEDGKCWSDSSRRLVVAAVVEAIGQLTRSQQEEWINYDLQVDRLKLLVGYVGTALLLTLAATTIVANPYPVRGWPVHLLTAYPAPIASVLASAGVAVLGAAGGLFSGLLVTEGAPASMLDYRTSIFRLILKPLVGALMACIIYIALSWQVVPGITVTNGGTFLVLGFVTGFSERYILRVLNVPGTSDRADSHDRMAGQLDPNAINQTDATKKPTGQRGSR